MFFYITLLKQQSLDHNCISIRFTITIRIIISIRIIIILKLKLVSFPFSVMFNSDCVTEPLNNLDWYYVLDTVLYLCEHTNDCVLRPIRVHNKWLA